jgi:hypothetical protein
MRLLSKSVITLGLAALMATPVMAQQRRGGGFGFGGRTGLSMLLSNPSVQEELKLDDAQKEKARDFADKSREKMEAARQELEGLDQQERGKKFREVMAESNTAARKAVADILKPEQTKRLEEIELQIAGANAFEEESLQKKLKITDEQKTAITSILQSSMEETRGLFSQDASPDERRAAMEKMRDIRKQTLSKVEAKLTDEQKSQYKEMLGSPFEVKFQPRGGN